MGNITKAELEKQHETSLINFLSNDSVDEDTRLYAAVLLYKRGSRFLAFQEWMKYKDRVLDYILDEQANTPARPFAPNIAQDLSGRLHNRVAAAKDHQDNTLSQQNANIAEVSNRIDIVNQVQLDHSVYTDEKFSQQREEYLKNFADHDQAISRTNTRMMLDRGHVMGSLDDLSKATAEKIQNLDNQFKASQIIFNNYKKATDRILAIGSIVILISGYLIHHFLR